MTSRSRDMVMASLAKMAMTSVRVDVYWFKAMVMEREDRVVSRLDVFWALDAISFGSLCG